MVKIPKNNSSKRLTREKWLSTALKILAREGGARIRIDGITKALGVTKGSFYWHFKDRDDFVMSLVNYWEESMTLLAIERLEKMGDTPQDRLFIVMETLWRENLARYELAIRAWAMHEPFVAKRVQKIDKIRYAFSEKIFADIGFKGDELAMRTTTFLTFQSTEHLLLLPRTKKSRYELLKLRHKMLITPSAK